MHKIQSFLFIMGGLGVLSGIVLHINQWDKAPYLLIGCAIVMTLDQLGSFKKKGNRTLNRLYSQQILASIILIFSGGAMFLFSGNEWIAGIAIAAFIYLYTSIRIPQEEKKLS